MKAKNPFSKVLSKQGQQLNQIPGKTLIMEVTVDRTRKNNEFTNETTDYELKLMTSY